MRGGEDDGREEGRKWTRPGIKSSGVAVAWMTPTCRMSWLKSCPLYSHPIPQKTRNQPAASQLHLATSHSIQRTLELTAERTSRRDKFHMQNQHVLMQLALCSKRLSTLPVSPQTSNSPLAIHYLLGEGSFSVKM